MDIELRRQTQTPLPPPPAAPARAGRDAYLGRYARDPAFLSEILALFRRESADSLAAIASACRTGDLARGGRAVHKLKGSLVMLDATDCLHLVRLMDDAFGAGRAWDVRDRLACLEHCLADLERTLEALAAD